MPILVHLTAEANVKSVRRAGIRGTYIDDGIPDGVFCMPVLSSYFVTHQWLRELKRRGQRTIAGVYFRLPPEEMVWVGHYGQDHINLPVGEAIGIIMRADDPLGYQIILPRSVSAAEIHKIRHISQVVGWRYQPGSHLREPCPCRVCLPTGSIKSRRIRARFTDDDIPGYAQLVRELQATSIEDVSGIIWQLDRIGRRTRRNADDLTFLIDHPAEEVQRALAATLGMYRGKRATEMLRTLSARPAAAVREASARGLLKKLGPGALPYLEPFGNDPVIQWVVEEYRRNPQRILPREYLLSPVRDSNERSR
jgi:hypothetical protein